jgi:hypothetical protein
MVAWQKKHRCRPTCAAALHRQGRKPRQAKVADIQAAQQRAGLVRTNIASQYQQVGAGQGLCLEMRMGFKVEVGQQLDVHPADCAARPACGLHRRELGRSALTRAYPGDATGIARLSVFIRKADHAFFA